MKQKTFNTFAGTLFAVIAFVHLLRIFNDWPANINTFVVPMWLSWVAVILGVYLAYSGLKKR